jgi:hypothetical protein
VYTMFLIYSVLYLSLFEPGAEVFFLLAKFRRQGGAKVLRLEHLANLDLGFLGHGIGTALDPSDRLLQRRAFPEPEAGNQLLCLGEWPVSHNPLLAFEPDARSFGTRMQPFAREHHAGFGQFLVVFSHCIKKFLTRRAPASEDVVALTMIMNRIVLSRDVCLVELFLHQFVVRQCRKSTAFVRKPAAGLRPAVAALPIQLGAPSV